MGFWFWFLVFVGIALAALLFYGLIAVNLFQKLKGLEVPATKLAELAAKMEQAAKAEVAVKSPVAALEQTEQAIAQRQSQIAKSRKAKKEARERRLVARLKHLEIDESRLRK